MSQINFGNYQNLLWNNFYMLLQSFFILSIVLPPKSECEHHFVFLHLYTPPFYIIFTCWPTLLLLFFNVFLQCSAPTWRRAFHRSCWALLPSLLKGHQCYIQFHCGFHIWHLTCTLCYNRSRLHLPIWPCHLKKYLPFQDHCFTILYHSPHRLCPISIKCIHATHPLSPEVYLN